MIFFIINLHVECYNLIQIRRNKNLKKLNDLQKNPSSTFLI